MIEKFINENLPFIQDSDEIPEKFEEFWQKERELAIENLCKKENLDSDKVREIIGNYMFTERIPLRDEIIAVMHQKPKLKERKSTAERIIEKILKFVETFINGFQIF